MHINQGVKLLKCQTSNHRLPVDAGPFDKKVLIHIDSRWNVFPSFIIAFKFIKESCMTQYLITKVNNFSYVNLENENTLTEFLFFILKIYE